MIQLPETIGRQLAEIDRRLRALEVGPRAANTGINDENGNMIYRSSQEGVFFYDTDGNVVAAFTPAGSSTFDPGDGAPRQVSGGFTDGVDSFTGWVLYDGDGRSMLMTRNDKPGLIKPDLSASMVPPTITAVTSGTYTTVVEAEHRRLYHDTLMVQCAVVADVGTTGEVRLREQFSGATTSAATIPSGGNGSVTFDWLHGIPLGDDPGAGAFFVLEARRTSGAGNLNVYQPRMARLTSSALVTAASSGLPAFYS